MKKKLLWSRRSLLGCGALAAGAWALGAAPQALGSGMRTIEIVARRFTFLPSQVPLKAGERVQVVVQGMDFAHGMNIPDLGKRYDLVPGQFTRFELQPSAPGTIEFLCDNFCGDGHETMHGRFVVT
ncbi:cupredoxin domain-containing protein [Variovorax sp. OV329]|uniref:cupredoxin domain-containing protein n=1 Tax=Variovorax sp. OV329 TaxID=1882825 RepID=UPI0008E603EF|nr:cupredoxin domain-containing protein [Variovorax sp. OV329]SFL90348.1 cytochrome c oxidase subunit 2 [Variovorax sp. OV329]